MDAFKPVISAIAAGNILTEQDAETAFLQLLSGEVSPAQIAAFLTGLRMRGETVGEIAGAVRAMRGKMLPAMAPQGAIDIVGTGGDGHGTYNVSTLAALIVAACGVPVAKHGNRAASSKSGSSDVLTALGVTIGLSPEAASRCLSEAGICFLWAQTHHAAMRHVGPVRSELGFRTIFNLLGPLCNPAGVKHQVLGVFSPLWLQPLAEVLRTLGSEQVWLVHGSDGLDEITTTGPTQVTALEHGEIRSFEITPEEAGLPRATLADLKGGDPAENAKALRAILDGGKGPYHDIAVFNAAAALVIAGKAAGLREGVAFANEALASGAAARTLEKLIAASRSGGSAAFPDLQTAAAR